MLSIVDLVVPYDGAAVGSDLDSRQGVTIDVVTLYQTSSISKYVHASLVTVENSISPRNQTKHSLGIDAKNEFSYMTMYFSMLHISYTYTSFVNR